MCTGAGWLDLACAVWDLLLENDEDPVIGVRFDGSLGSIRPEMVEFNTPRQVRKSGSRIMTLGFRRGDFGELLGGIAQEQEAAHRIRGVQLN